MEKDHFLFLTKNYASLSLEETNELQGLQEEFPYCQPARVLSIRGCQMNGKSNFKQELGRAAVYITDRVVLKEILSEPVTRRFTEVNSNATPSITYQPQEGLAEEVMADLLRLKELRNIFEVTLDEYNKGLPPVDTNKTPRVNSTAPGRSKELGDFKHEESRSAKSAPAMPIEPHSDSLLDEISSKRKLRAEGPKQKEQIEIIDQFIKKQPAIGKLSAPAVETTDLAENSIALTENIVSETLVEILLRQGKKDKAIEVLKKLIWKFPQKKSIFAAQIEELKK